MTEEQESAIEKKQSLRVGPRVETRLVQADIKRLDAAAKTLGQTRAEFKA